MNCGADGIPLYRKKSDPSLDPKCEKCWIYDEASFGSHNCNSDLVHVDDGTSTLADSGVALNENDEDEVIASSMENLTDLDVIPCVVV